MNKKAKIIIAALILIFLGLIIYAFAAPKDDEDELDNRVQQVEKDKDTSKDTEKESEEESTKKEETNKEATPTDEKEKTEEQKSTEEEPEAVNESYAQALALVEKAENSLSEEDVAAAKEAIANVVDADTTELEERIEAVESDILARTLVETLKTMVDEAEEQTDIEEARNYNNDNEVANAVENVNNEELKAVLEETYAEAKNVLEDTTKPEIVGAPENGITNENVSLTIDDDTEVTIALTKDGEQVDPTLEISGDGEYVVTVTDEAFNVTEITFIIDTVKPVIELKGEAEVTIERTLESATYVDEGAKATDAVDPAEQELVPSKITKDGVEVESIDTSVVGTYVVYFDALDTAGNPADQVTRTVIVVDTTAPIITVDVETSKTKGVVVAEFTLTSNEEIEDPGNGWELSDDKKTLTQVFTAKGNAKKIFGSLEVKDLYGNPVVVNYTAEEFDLEVKVNYSTEDATKDPVTVTISLTKVGKYKDRVLIAPTDTAWKMNEKGSEITQTFDENTKGVITLYDNYGHSVEVEYVVTNIDNDEPSAKLSKEYNAETNTVVVTITADEKIALIDENWSYVDNNTQTSIKKEYSKNQEETVLTVNDLAGNTSNEMSLVINEIDEEEPELVSVEYYVGEEKVTEGVVTQGPVTVIVTASEALTLPEGWSFVGENDNKITNTFSTEMNGSEVVLTDKYGNAQEESTKLLFTIDLTGPKVLLNGNDPKESYTEAVEVTVEEEGARYTVTKNDAQFEGAIDSTGKYVVTAIDTLGNETKVTFIVTIETQEEPEPQVVQLATVKDPEIIEIQGNKVNVKITFNQDVDLPSGWSYADTSDKTTILLKDVKQGNSAEVKHVEVNALGNEENKTTVYFTIPKK